MAVSALGAALNAVWAMEERALEALLDIAARDIEVNPEALEAYRAKTLASAQQAKIRDGVAVIDANGALFKRANLLAAMSGATSYEIMRADLQAALDDPKVKAILFNIDSPGGEAHGAGEISRAIFDARGQKPITAYVGGTGASAAYWIASAADRIVVDPSAMLGSIGVQVAVGVKEPKAGEKKFRFVSSQSPLKNPEPGTEEFASEVQTVIDAMAQVFVEDVARNRGVATETVLQEFGKGGNFVGQMAVAAGLADAVGTYESAFAELSATKTRRKGRNGVKAKMEDEVAITAADVASAAANAVTEERARVAGLRKLGALGATDADITAAIEAGTSVAAFASQVADKAEAQAQAEATAAAEAEAERVRSEDAAREKEIQALKTDEEKAKDAEASTGAETDTVEALALRIANA